MGEKRLDLEIRECGALIDAADRRIAAFDGPVQPTATEMSSKDVARCLRCLWRVHEAMISGSLGVRRSDVEAMRKRSPS